MVASDDSLYDFAGEFVFEISIEVFGLIGERRFGWTGWVCGFTGSVHYLIYSLHVALCLLVHSKGVVIIMKAGNKKLLD